MEITSSISKLLSKIDSKFQIRNLMHVRIHQLVHTPIDDTTVKIVKQEMDQFVEKPCESQNIRLAENERNKGNEALRSNDLKEALNYYTKSIQYDNTMAASYCNRALVYLKLKEYQNVISDCNQALILQKSYTKALHRRGKAYFALKDYIKAYLDFKEIIKIEPDNSEVNGELRECRKMVTDQEIRTAENQEFLKTQGAFKKVQIQEEDDEEEIPVSKTQDYSKEIADVEIRKNQIAVQIQKGLYADSINNIIELLKETHDLIGKCENTSLRILRVSLFSNLALCYHQLQDYKKVIEYSKIILEDEQAPNDMLIKAHLRCGLAYEALDNLPNSKDHFSQVKAMDPGNLQASQGLARLSKIMTTEEHSLFEQKKTVIQQSEPKKPQEQQQQQQNQQLKEPMIQEQSKCGISDAEVFDQLKKIKDSGNELYKQKKYSEAHDAFLQGIAFYEANPAPIHIQLFVQLITNSCLCLSFIDRNDEIIELSKKAIDIDPNNLKALYRRGVAYQALAVKNPDLEAQNALFELSRNDLEKVAYLDTANKQAIDKLAEVQRQNVECRVKLKEQKPKVDPLPEKVIAPKQEAPIVKQTITPSQTQQIAQGLALNVINDILAKKTIPDSASTFEKNMNTFKKASSEQIIDYAYQASNLTTLYAKKDIPTDIILQILKAGETTQGIKKEELTAIFRDRIPKTAKFDLCTKMLSKKEKEDLRRLFADLGLDELQNTYKI